MFNTKIEKLQQQIYDLHESIFNLSQRLNLLREEQFNGQEKILGEISKMIMYHPIPSTPLTIPRLRTPPPS